MALGLAASNTGNNLLYLLVSTLLGLLVVSGILSEQSLRGLRLSRLAPGDIFAGQPVLLPLLLTNTKRRLASYSVLLETPGSGGSGVRVSYIPKLGPGQDALVTVEERFPRRGRHRLPGIRIATRFPFGLFLKAARPVIGEDVLVYPAIRPLTPEDLRRLEGEGRKSRPQAGQGTELHNLRDYRWGDDPRLIHWRSSAKAATPLVRELEAEAAPAVRLVLEPAPAAEPEQLEAALSGAASLACSLIGQGAEVELLGPGVHVPRGQGPAHLRRILEALALFEPDGGAAPGAELPVGAPIRVIRIPMAGVAS